MIVLDEELQGLGLEAAISRWYRGSVILVKALRPGTVVKDEAIPGLLRQVRRPTFVTINHADFWRRTAAERAFCLLCLKLTADRVDDVSSWLRRLLRNYQSFAPKTREWEKSLCSACGVFSITALRIDSFISVDGQT